MTSDTRANDPKIFITNPVKVVTAKTKLLELAKRTLTLDINASFRTKYQIRLINDQVVCSVAHVSLCQSTQFQAIMMAFLCKGYSVRWPDPVNGYFWFAIDGYCQQEAGA